MTEPTFVALDGGYLYVANHGDVPSGTTMPANGGNIIKIDLSNGNQTVIATRGTGNGQFISPDAILVDPSTHNLFIADRWLNRVQEITNTGTYVMQFGSGTVGATNEMHGPVGLARDSSGAIYVTEHGDTNGAGVAGNVVDKYTISGTTATQVWKKGNNLNVPYSVAFDAASGHLLISDGFNNQIQVWDTNGTPITTHAVPAIALGGSFDGSGNFWMGTAGGNTAAPQEIVKLNPTTGAQLATFGSAGSANGQFALPFDVAVNAATNTAYVSDYNNNRVQAINLAASAPTGSAPSITSSTTASGTVGQNFTYQITATNSPTSYNNVDALPGGLTLNTSTGVISGIPSTAGTTTTHLTATNSSGTSSQFALTITIAAATSTNTGTPAAPLGPTITAFALDGSSVNQTAGTAVMQLTFDTAVTGVDATDFAVNTQGSTTASITGVTAVNATTYRVAFSYTNVNGAMQMAIKTSGTGITDSSGNAFRGSGYTATPAYPVGSSPAADTTAPTVSSFTAGAPSGNNVTYTVTFSEPVTGVDASDFIVTGTSATVGTISGSGTTYTVPVTASGSGTVTLTVIGGATANIRDIATNWFAGQGSTSASAVIASTGGTPSAPTISNQTVTGTQGQALSYQVSASGATSFSITAGTLPSGLSMSSAGLVTGTPSASGTSTVTVQAANTAGNASAQLTFNIAAATTGSAPTIANQSASGTQNAAFSYQVQATGATSFSITGGTLPAGLSMSSAGLITGTPTASGTSNVTVQATNANGSAQATVSITIAAAGSAPTISNQTANATQNAAFSYQVQASGATSFSIAAGTLPAGLSMSSTGLITGTPAASGTSTVTVKATNANGSAQATVTINVAAAGTVPTIADQTVSGTVGTSLSYQVQASGATSFSVVSGSLANGLTMNSSGLITGTPTVSGTISATVQATNATGNAQATVTFNISAAPVTPPPPAAGAPVVGSAGLSLTSGIPMVYTVQATNSPTSFTLSGAPSGLTISKTGVISGTPIATGTYNATVTATNSAGSGTGTLTFTITASTSPGPIVKKGQTVIFNSPVSTVFVGDSFKLAAQDSSGLPITYSIISGNATLSGDTLLVTGAGPVVIRALQPGSDTYLPATADITITVEKKAQQIQVPSVSMVHTDDGYTFAATTDTGLPISYKIVSGPATVEGNKLTFTGSGTVVVQAEQDGNSQYAATTNTITLTGNPVPRLVNISSRLMVSKGDANGASIAGFVVTGNAPKQILIRAVGPTLAKYHLSAPLADPTLKLYNSNGDVIATNSGWEDNAQIKSAGDGVGAFDLEGGSKDAAVLVTLQPGAYTVQVQSPDSSGTVLIEVYDVSANAPVPTKQLINISTRGYVGTGDNVLIAGFAVSGTEPKQILVRAVGPTLANFKVGGALSDPVLTINDASGNPIAKNDDWGTAVKVANETPATAAQIAAADTATGAFALPSGSKDAAVVLTLQPGQYTAVVTGANGATGAAMVEVYEIPNP